MSDIYPRPCRDQGSLAELLDTTGSELQGVGGSAPLPLLFTWASRIHRHNDQVNSLDAPQREEAVAVCRMCMARVQAAALFSANEDADDLATADMKYLLAPFYLAEVLSSCPTPEGAGQRAPLVEEALRCYTLFLDHCQQYGMLGKLGTNLYFQDAQVSGQAGGMNCCKLWSPCDLCNVSQHSSQRFRECSLFAICNRVCISVMSQPGSCGVTIHCREKRWIPHQSEQPS